MPYEVICPIDSSVSVLNALGEVKDDQGNIIGYDHSAKVWSSGDVIPDEEVSPVVIKLLDEGDEYTCSQLRRIPGKQKATVAPTLVEEPVTTEDSVEQDSPLRLQVDKNLDEKPAAPAKMASKK